MGHFKHNTPKQQSHATFIQQYIQLFLVVSIDLIHA